MKVACRYRDLNTVFSLEIFFLKRKISLKKISKKKMEGNEKDIEKKSSKEKRKSWSKEMFQKRQSVNAKSSKDFGLVRTIKSD